MPNFEKTGSLPFDPAIDPAHLPSHLAECLRGVRASDVQLHGDQVTFTGGAFRLVTSLNPLYYFGSGDLTVDPVGHVVAYRLNYQQSVYFAVIAFLVVAVVLSSVRSAAWFIFVFPFICVALIFLGVSIGLLRFESFLRRALASASKPAVTV